MHLEVLRKSLRQSPIVMKGDYPYFVHPITDGIPVVPPDMLEEVACAMAEIIDLNVDRIVGIEAMGIHIATALSLKTSIPFTVIRKRKYGLPGEVEVEQKTGYGGAKLYINGIKRGDRVVVVDDVVSTGGTLRAVISALKSMGVNIRDVCVVFKKGKSIEEVDGVKIKYLLEVDIVDGNLVEVAEV